MALNATDIFKGELLKHAKEHEREEFVSRWNDLSQKCSDNDLKIETLFSWYLTYLNPVTSKEKMEKRLVTWFKNLNKPPLEYFKGVEDFYNAYCKVLEMQDWHAHLLSYLASDFWRIILCASLLHRYSDQDIEALKELLVKFYYQNWVATREEPKKQTNCNIINALKEKKSVESIASVVKEYLDYHKITQDFKKNLQDSKLYEQHKKSSKNSWLRPILILVEYSMSDDPRPKRIQMNDFHVEHILPQQPGSSSQWVKDFSEEERGLYTHSLANLTLLGGTKNAQASNLDFKEKKEIYMGNAVKLGKDKRGREKTFKVMTCYKMTIDIATNYTEWTPTSLEKRKEELIKRIESVLAL
ncbi:HNH endonuclease family protein [Helicobacter pylori]|nr:HNH endonuclease family protein [Helicobacter pylori]